MTQQEIPQQTDEWVWLARIRRPQGRKGEVFADILTDFPEKFADRKNLWLLAEHPAAENPRSVTGPDRGTAHSEWGAGRERGRKPRLCERARLQSCRATPKNRRGL